MSGEGPVDGVATGGRPAPRRRFRDGEVALSAGGFAIWLALRVLGATTRRRFVDRGGLLERFASGEPAVLCFWHGRMIMMPFAYFGRGACIMNSAHRDGELISRAIRRLGIETVRGSSTRGWVGGLKGLLAAHRRGRDVIVVPDGPRGPRCRAKTGALQLARATGAPIWPVSFAADRARIVSRSWDRMLIPLPFARVVYVAEAPIEVPRDASPEQVEGLRRELEARLDAATREAGREVGADPDETERFLSGLAGSGES
ncbi:MAG: lysophospholipid acyltransferase family protein [Alphaproteobacteria bacterium]